MYPLQCRLLKRPEVEKKGQQTKALSTYILIFVGESPHCYRLTALDAPSFNHQFDRGGNESILIGLGTVLGVGLLRI